jgi:hypothetical protein
MPGSRSRHASVTRDRAALVNRIDRRRPLRDRNRGAPSLRPLRSPLQEAKKFRYAVFASASACCSTTADTSASHVRCGVRLAAVSAFDRAASVGYGSPASRTARRAATASLNTTRAHPNARANDPRWAGVGLRRHE